MMIYILLSYSGLADLILVPHDLVFLEDLSWNEVIVVTKEVTTDMAKAAMIHANRAMALAVESEKATGRPHPSLRHCHRTIALSLGDLLKTQPLKEKVGSSIQLHQHCQKAIALSKSPVEKLVPHIIMGFWCLAVAEVPWTVKALAKVRRHECSSQ
jgi:hypothetical protein